MPIPYIMTSLAPAKYRGSRGPGMLVTTVLSGGLIRLAISKRDAVRAASPASPPGTNCGISVRVLAPMALLSAFDLVVDSCTAPNRSSGSAMLLATTDEHRRHLVARGAPLRLRAHRHRGHRHQRLVGQLTLVPQVGAQRPPDDRQHGIVDRGAGDRRLHPADVAKIEAARVHDPVRLTPCR